MKKDGYPRRLMEEIRSFHECKTISIEREAIIATK
jgi:hypothetical protein